MLPIRNISYLLPMGCSFWEKYKNSPKTGLGCSTPLKKLRQTLFPLMGELLLKPKIWACFVHFLKIINTVLKKKTTNI